LWRNVLCASLFPSFIAHGFSLNKSRSKSSKYSTICGIITSASPIQRRSKKGDNGKGLEETAAPPAIRIGLALFSARGSIPAPIIIFKTSK